MRDLPIHPDIDSMWRSLFSEAPRYMDPYVSDHRLHLPILAGEDMLYLGCEEGGHVRNTRSGGHIVLASIKVGVGNLLFYASQREIRYCIEEIHRADGLVGARAQYIEDVGQAFVTPRAWQGKVYHDGEYRTLPHYWCGFDPPTLSDAHENLLDRLDLTPTANYYWCSTIHLNPVCTIEVYEIEEVLPYLYVSPGFLHDNEDARQHLAWVREGVEMVELLRRSW